MLTGGRSLLAAAASRTVTRHLPPAYRTSDTPPVDDGGSMGIDAVFSAASSGTALSPDTNCLPSRLMAVLDVARVTFSAGDILTVDEEPALGGAVYSMTCTGSVGSPANTVE